MATAVMVRLPERLALSSYPSFGLAACCLIHMKYGCGTYLVFLSLPRRRFVKGFFSKKNHSMIWMQSNGSVRASNAPVYTRCRLLVADGPKPPVYRRSPARCTSRRWRLLTCPILGRKECPAAPPPKGARLPSASTTARLRMVSKCALQK